MNQSLIKKTPLNLDGPATWDTVKYWADLAAKFQHASVAAQVMAGFGLLELRTENNVKPGRPKELPHDAVINVPHNPTAPHGAVRLTWPELVEKHAGISDDTATRWINMAKGIKAKWKKLKPQDRLKQLMSVSPTEWQEKDIKLITDAVHKVTDGKSQLEFMWELGIAKKPGNSDPKGPGSRTLTTAEKQAQVIQMALDDSSLCGQWTMASLKSFPHTARENDLTIDALISVHEFATKVLLKYRNTPRKDRNEALLKEIETLIKKESPLNTK